MDTIRTLDFLLAGVLMPRGCCGCSEPDAVLCPQCAVLFSGVHSRALPSVTLGQTYACAQYSSRVRHAIISWKDHGDWECDGVFAAALVELTRKIHLIDALAGRALLVVPAPSTRRSVRRRGRWHMRDLARRYVSLLRSQGVDARMGTVLAMPSVRSKAVEHSGRQQRSSRASGVRVVRPEVLRGVGGVDAATLRSMTGVQDSETLRGVSVVLLDDIVTTGATMRSCVRALRDAGADVVTCLALAQVDASSPVRVDLDRSVNRIAASPFTQQASIHETQTMAIRSNRQSVRMTMSLSMRTLHRQSARTTAISSHLVVHRGESISRRMVHAAPVSSLFLPLPRMPP